MQTLLFQICVDVKRSRQHTCVVRSSYFISKRGNVFHLNMFTSRKLGQVHSSCSESLSNQMFWGLKITIQANLGKAKLLVWICFKVGSWLWEEHRAAVL